MQSSIATQRWSRLAVILASGLAVFAASASADHPTEPEQLQISRRSEIGCVSPAVPDVPPDTIPPLPNGSCLPGFDQISWW